VHEASESAVPEELRQLIEHARLARERAYAPYSGYRVGAAVRTNDGRVFRGCNVENATYGATICAERAAVVGMVTAGVRELAAVAVFTDGGPLGMPCGICRQTLVEFGLPETPVVVASPRETRLTTLGALLPEPFVLRS
jgi:cytidine deaminase